MRVVILSVFQDIMTSRFRHEPVVKLELGVIGTPQTKGLAALKVTNAYRGRSGHLRAIDMESSRRREIVKAISRLRVLVFARLGDASVVQVPDRTGRSDNHGMLDLIESYVSILPYALRHSGFIGSERLRPIAKSYAGRCIMGAIPRRQGQLSVTVLVSIVKASHIDLSLRHLTLHIAAFHLRFECHIRRVHLDRHLRPSIFLIDIVIITLEAQCAPIVHIVQTRLPRVLQGTAVGQV